MTPSTRNWSRLLDLIDGAVPAAASARRTSTTARIRPKEAKRWNR
jgi:hypothetical protein